MVRSVRHRTTCTYLWGKSDDNGLNGTIRLCDPSHTCLILIHIACHPSNSLLADAIISSPASVQHHSLPVAGCPHYLKHVLDPLPSYTTVGPSSMDHGRGELSHQNNVLLLAC